MNKKVMSIITTGIIVITSLYIPISTSAATYEESLKSKGFPDTYISYLTALHNKYPNWDFEVLNTNLDFQTAVNGERSSHSKQLIEKTSSRSDNFYCSCSSCKAGGNYVVRESPNWVSASEGAVKYYMDPRNWIDENHIFQFETNSYSSEQTADGVETILNGTFMHNSTISYYTTSGTRKTYVAADGSSPKYSQAIIDASKTTGLNAYYIASRIVQEVGSASQTTIGTCGNQAPFQGIYNFFSIGATSGAMQGLEWASGFLKSNKATTLFSTYSSGTVGGTTSAVPADTLMTWRATSGNYYKVRLYTISGGKYIEGATGYVAKADCRDTYFSYSRPWSNPYKAITGGASYIATSFSTVQNTTYLEKFDVNPATSNLYSHEYMANVIAPSAESEKTYSAYSKAGILANKHTFLIPVYKNMPATTSVVSSTTTTPTTSTSSNKVSGLTLTARTTTTLTYKWNAVSGATKYRVSLTNKTTGKTVTKDVTTTSTKLKNLTPTSYYGVKVKAYVGSAFGSYSSTNSKHTMPGKVKGITSARAVNAIRVKWTKAPDASSYKIYKYSPSKKEYTLVGTCDGKSSSYRVEKLKSATTYYYTVTAVIKDSKTKESAKASNHKTCTKPNKIKSTSLSKKNKALLVKWSSTKCTGYQIKYSTSSSFKSSKTKTVSGSSAKSATVSNLKSGKKYYVKVRAYKTASGKKSYGKWSSAKSIKVK